MYATQFGRPHPCPSRALQPLPTPTDPLPSYFDCLRALFCFLSLWLLLSAPSMAVEPIPFLSPERGGPRNFVTTTRCELRDSPSQDGSSQLMLPAGTPLDNLGCQQLEDGIWCDLQPLGGGPRGYLPSNLLRPARSPNGVIATGVDDSALRAGRGEYDGRGRLPCRRKNQDRLALCAYGIARAGGGYATLVVAPPGPRAGEITPPGVCTDVSCLQPREHRVIYFRLGQAIGTGGSEAGGWPTFSVRRQVEDLLIQIDDERYLVADRLLYRQ